MAVTVRFSSASFCNTDFIKLPSFYSKYWSQNSTNRHQIVWDIMSSWGMFEVATSGRGAGIGVDDCEKYCNWVLVEGGGRAISALNVGNDGMTCFVV